MIFWGHLDAADADAARYRYTEERDDGAPEPDAGILVVPGDDWTACRIDGRDDVPHGAVRVARKVARERDATGEWPERTVWFSC
ncbi:hypothetical protein GXP71_19625 [Cellulomonas sp. H30R-01]|uniref:hypothetical protein n=1 Tax=Cellulomonas sp. H30R-01 TaxID=2704467 RepID=UPI00138BEE39|nr:hypothetical protein [Cellulomonas sp. H30R-01]QHT58073.1 hypothetical protein GXP71_19625 [Cellulomonas sp. H30R-01]